MLEVVCVKKPNVNISHPGNPFPEIEIGEFKQVRYLIQIDGIEYYSFVDIDELFLYTVNMFAPCNGPDEVDLMEERYQEEISRLDAEYENIASMLDQTDNL